MTDLSSSYQKSTPTKRKLASDLKPGDIVIVNPSDPEQDIIVHSTEQVDGNWTAVYEEAMRYRHDIEVDVYDGPTYDRT